MTKKSKKVTLGLVALLAVSFGVVGATALNGVTTKTADAASVTFTMDAIGNLKWTATSGATGYNCSYTVGSDTVSFTTETNTANVGVALTKAVKAAQADGVTDGEQATVSFSVAPIGVDGDTATYTYSFDSYIDYGYTTHDITDVNGMRNTQYGQMFGGSGTSTYTGATAGKLDGYKQSAATYSGYSKNQLLTMGLTRLAAGSSSTSYNTQITLLCDATSTADIEKSGYTLQMNAYKGGCIVTPYGGTKQTATYSEFDARLDNDNYATKVAVGGTYNGLTHGYSKAINANVMYLKMGVFDVYNLDGTWKAEKVFVTGQKTTSTGSKNMGTVNFDFTTKQPDVRESTTDEGVLLNRSCVRIYSQNIIHWMHAYDDSAKPTNIYYDNADATVNWNAVDGADSYEYALGDGAWTATENTYVDVSSAMSAYAGVGFMPVRVRAVTAGEKGTVATYTLDVSKEYAKRSTVQDVYALSDEGAENLNFTHAGGAMAVNNSQMGLGTHVTFSFVSDGEQKGFRLFGTENDFSGYNVTFYPNTESENGYIVISRSNFGLIDSVVYKEAWKCATRTFTKGERYFVTFGVDEMQEDGEKVAERIFLRLAVSDGNGGYETLYVTTYDNEQCGEGEAAYSVIPEEDGGVSYVVYDGCQSAITWEKNAVSLTLDGAIGANAYMNISTPSRALTESLKVNVAGEEVALPQAETSGACKGLYKFESYMPAKAIDEEISIELVVGEKSSKLGYTYTVREYIDIVQADEATYGAKLVALATALEDYCEATAVYFNVENAEINNRSRIDAITTDVFTKADTASGTDETIERVAISLLTESKTIVRLYVKATAMPTITAKVGDGEVQAMVVTEMVFAGESYYCVDVEVDGFSLSKDIQFNFNGGDATYTCCALTYGMLMDTTNSKLVDLVKALYLYDVAATAYKA